MAALQLVNVVRSEQFNEAMVSGSLYLLAQRLRHDPEALPELAARFDATLKVIPFDVPSLTPYQYKRLERGRPLFDSTNDGRTVRLLYPLSDHELLDVQLDSVTELQAQATAILLVEEWQYSGEPLTPFLERVQAHFGFPLHSLSMDRLLLSDADYARMQYGDVLVRITLEGKEAEALVKVGANDQVLRLGPIRVFNPYSWQALLVIALIGGAVLGVGVFWVVSSFETRLRKLEQATSRLAQGNMNARVAIQGNDPVGRLGLTFNKMAGHIQRLMDIQREMIRAVSHELRTPVARIRFAAQLIEDSVDDGFVQKQLQGIDTDIQELDGLIDEILTYARLEEGGPLLDFQASDVAVIAQQVVNEARPPAGITVRYEGDAADSGVLADIEIRYVHRAIQNLVGNACRYASSQVLVRCRVGMDTCRVDVEDDGSGIPEHQWERVFTAFARLDDSRTRSSGGYGLGLSIVQRIAYWHSGRALVLHSNELGGAKFSLIWPRRLNE